MAVRRRRPNPLAWAVVVGVVVVLFLLIRAISGGDDYSPRALAVAGETARLGQDVAALRTQLKTLDRLVLFRRLRTWERESQSQLDLAKELSPPKDLRVTNGYLLAALGLRAEGMRRFNPSVRNALSDRDMQVAVSQLINVSKDLVLSDRSYELFQSTWPKDREKRPGASKWVADPDDASIDGVTAFVRELRLQPALAATYNLTVSSIVVDPKPTGKERDVDLLPFTRTLSVSVVVTNTGNQPVPGVPVAVILTSEADPEPKTLEGTLGALKAGEKKSITIKGHEPTAGGPINLLRVVVGPAGGEKNTLDNTVEYKFAMRKP